MKHDELDPLPDDLQRLLRGGRPGFEPPPASRDAALSFIALHAGTALGVVAATSVAANAAHAASTIPRGALVRGWLALKGSVGIGGLIIGAAVGAAGHAALVKSEKGSAPSSVASSGPQASAAVSASTTPAASAAPSGAIAPSLPATTPPPSPSITQKAEDPHARGASDTALGSERALIDMARTSVARGQGDAALAALERHGREFPRGRLAEEREWLAIQALLLTGRTGDAKQRAARFRQTYPHSLMLPALDEALPSRSE